VVPDAGPSGNQVYDDAIEKMDGADGAMGAPQASLEGRSSGFTFCASLQRASLRRGANAHIKTEFSCLLGLTGHTFMVCIHTENQNQGDFCPFALLEIPVLHEPPLGHLRYGLTDVPPRPNSSPENVFNPDRPTKDLNARSWTVKSSRLDRVQNWQLARQRHRGDG
jgi:hypothetical protein